MLSTKTTFDQYPSSEQVYTLFQQLRNYFSKYGAKEVGIPMLNVTVTAPGVFQTQVAIPIDKDVPQTEDTRMKYMFKGDALTADVTGGNYTINKALNAMEQYRTDYALMSPAIPFQSLVTDRLKEKDTTKWITKLYYPIR